MRLTSGLNAEAEKAGGQSSRPRGNGQQRTGDVGRRRHAPSSASPSLRSRLALHLGPPARRPSDLATYLTVIGIVTSRVTSQRRIHLPHPIASHHFARRLSSLGAGK